MNRLLLTILALCLGGCGSAIKTTPVKKYPALKPDAEVHVIKVHHEVPAGELLGEVRIGDSGFSTNCGYDVVIEHAKMEARKIGGNVLKLTEHKLPSMMSSSCHRIRANIMLVQNPEQFTVEDEEPVLGDVDYAMVHVYRPSGAGPLVGYDLYLGDSVIYRMKNNSKASIMIKKDGRNMVWAKTESKVEIPINIKFGYEYYIRCGLTMGLMVGRPTLELVDRSIGKSEFDNVAVKKTK